MLRGRTPLQSKTQTDLELQVLFLQRRKMAEEEIRRSPVEVGSLSHHLQGFIHPRWLAGFLKSTVGILYYTIYSYGKLYLVN